MSQLQFTPLKIEHAKQVFHYLQEDALYNFIPDQKYNSVQALEKRYQQLTQGSGRTDELWINWLIYQDIECQQTVGTIQATIFPEQQLAYVGYVIFKPFWGQGYATSAVLYLEKYLAQNHSISKIEAYVDPQNFASIKVLENNHFKYIRQEDNDLVYVKKLLVDE